MKSNPSRRNASTSFLDILRAELDALTQQLQDAETAANTAQQEADAKRRAYHELEQRSNSTHWSVTEQRLFREKNQLEAVARQLQQELVPLREEHTRLKRKVEAPAQLEAARVEMAALPGLPMKDLWALWDAHFPRRPAEVIPVFRFVQPTALTGRFAGPAAFGLRTVALMPEVAWIGME